MIRTHASNLLKNPKKAVQYGQHVVTGLVLWVITTASFWPQPWNRQQFTATYPPCCIWKANALTSTKNKNIQSSLACSLCVIHVQAICSGTRDGVFSWVPRKMKQFCWEVIRISNGLNACIFSTSPHGTGQRGQSPCRPCWIRNLMPHGISAGFQSGCLRTSRSTTKNTKQITAIMVPQELT